MSGVDLFQIRHSRISAQFRVQLSATDVDAHDVRRTRLERTIGESTGRGADIQHVSARKIQSEPLDGAGERPPD